MAKCPFVTFCWLDQKCVFYVLFFFLCLLCPSARLFICDLWSPAGKRLTSWRLFVVYNCEFVIFHWYLGSAVVLDCVDS